MEARAAAIQRDLPHCLAVFIYLSLPRFSWELLVTVIDR